MAGNVDHHSMHTCTECTPFYSTMLHLGTMAAKKPPLLTPFLTPVAPRRARDRVPSILALGLFLPVSDFTQPENGLPTPPLPFPYTGCHQTASYSPKMAPLHFCTSGSEMPLTEEPGLYKRPYPARPHILCPPRILCLALCACNLCRQRRERAL